MENPVRLPAHRKLTPDELRGFRIACACMVTWAQQLVTTATRPGRDDTLPETTGPARQLALMASALDVQAARGAF